MISRISFNIEVTPFLILIQHYANAGMQTCLVLQSQDPSADYLLGCKIGSTPTAFSDGALDVLRLESTKVKEALLT
jgi:arsenite-transporting ATPase